MTITERKNSKNIRSHLRNSNAEGKPENSHHLSLMDKLGIQEKKYTQKKQEKILL